MYCNSEIGGSHDTRKIWLLRQIVLNHGVRDILKTSLIDGLPGTWYVQQTVMLRERHTFVCYCYVKINLQFSEKCHLRFEENIATPDRTVGD